METESEARKYELLKPFINNNTPDAKVALMSYFKSIPPSPVTTNPNSDAFKSKVFELILSVLGQAERIGFVLDTIDEETRNMRNAKEINYANMYPVKLWANIIATIDKEVDFTPYSEKLSSIALDSTLPDQFRTDAMTRCKQYESRSKDEIENIREILQDLDPQPEWVVPWEDFNDPVKRKKFYAENINSYNPSASWIRAGKEVKYDSDFERLKKFGLKAIEQILTMLEDESLKKERRDALAKVAANIFAGLQNLSMNEKRHAGALEKRFVEYIQKMEDKGAFSYRFYAIQGLACYYNKTGRTKDFPLKYDSTSNDNLFLSSIFSNRPNSVKSKSPSITTQTMETIKSETTKDQKDVKKRSCIFTKHHILFSSSVVLCCIAAFILWKRKNEKRL
jgi:hypothetical protein